MLLFFPTGNCLFPISSIFPLEIFVPHVLCWPIVFVGMSKAFAQRTVNIFFKDGAPIRTLAVHIMNQIVGSEFSLIPSNDYK